MKISIPMAVQVVIDDVGWWSGQNDHATGGPYRTGMPRDHVVADYEAIISLGKRLGMRPQAAMILCEWDRTNILRHVPTATWQGKDWDNRRWVGPWLDEAAALMQTNSEHIELTLHGLGHEYWDETGCPTRAEWFDDNRRMRPEIEVRAHLEAYAKIMEQNELGPFPESMVPPAYRYRFKDADGFTDIVSEYGIRYLTTVVNRDDASFQSMASPWFGEDGALLTVEWGASLKGNRALLPWYVVGSTISLERQVEGPVLGLHWPNLLHHDPSRNSEVIDRWVAYLRQYEKRMDRMLAQDTREGYAQLLYHWGTEVSFAGRILQFDFSRFDTLKVPIPKQTFIIKIQHHHPPVLDDSDDLKVTYLPDRSSENHHLFRVERIRNTPTTTLIVTS